MALIFVQDALESEYIKITSAETRGTKMHFLFICSFIHLRQYGNINLIYLLVLDWR